MRALVLLVAFLVSGCLRPPVSDVVSVSRSLAPTSDARVEEASAGSAGNAGKTNAGRTNAGNATEGAGFEPSSLAALFERMDRSDVICVGELHSHASHHRVQRLLLRQLVARRGQRRIALGMEMFRRPHQRALDDYVRGVLDDRGLRWRDLSGMAVRILHRAGL